MIIDAVRRQGNGDELIVPAKQPRWVKSIEPSRTPLSRYPGISDIRDQLIGEAKQHTQGTGIERVLRCKDVERFLTGDRVSDAAWRTIETVGQLSAVDGALIVTKTLDLVTFGAKMGMYRNAVGGRPEHEVPCSTLFPYLESQSRSR